MNFTRGRLTLSGSSTVGANAGQVRLNCHSSQFIENAVGGTTKLEINSSGASVTGVLTATSFEGDGSALTNLPASSIAGINTTGTSYFNNINIEDLVKYYPIHFMSKTLEIPSIRCSSGTLVLVIQ